MGQFSDIDQVYQKETRNANMLYEFVILYHNYIYAQHTYEAENCNMMEIHTLTYIDDSPGITVTQLSKIWHKSKSAISQTVKKLMEAGYVEKRYTEYDKKTACLYVTEKGKRLSSLHTMLQTSPRQPHFWWNSAARRIWRLFTGSSSNTSNF